VIVESIVAYREPLLRNDREINETTAVARQLLARNNGSTVGSGVFRVVRAETMTQSTGFSALEYSGVIWVGGQSGGQQRVSRCELLL
jgi:hypothetical protein